MCTIVPGNLEEPTIPSVPRLAAYDWYDETRYDEADYGYDSIRVIEKESKQTNLTDLGSL